MQLNIVLFNGIKHIILYIKKFISVEIKKTGVLAPAYVMNVIILFAFSCTYLSKG